MKVGMVGLGRMGGNMTVRLIRSGHEVVAYDPNESARDGAATAGAMPAATLEELVAALEPPRVVWLMIPAGQVTDSGPNAQISTTRNTNQSVRRLKNQKRAKPIHSPGR